MARLQKSLTIKTISSTDIEFLGYEVPKKTTTAPSLVVTNFSNSINTISIYINDTENDFLLAEKKIPSGIGKTWRVLELSDLKLNAGYKIKVQQSSSDPVNYFLSGSEITES